MTEMPENRRSVVLQAATRDELCDRIIELEDQVVTLRAAEAAAREEERRRCKTLPQPPARLSESILGPMTDNEKRAYAQAWRDYATAIRALAGEDKP